MKIAMIGQKRVPSREGGVEIVVEELAVRMAALGHQVDCYNRWDLPAKGAAKPLKEYKGVRLIQIPTFRHQTLNAFVYSVLATIRAVFGGYDVIHFHAEGPCAMTFCPNCWEFLWFPPFMDWIGSVPSGADLPLDIFCLGSATRPNIPMHC